jgi:hypothetical protein
MIDLVVIDIKTVAKKVFGEKMKNMSGIKDFVRFPVISMEAALVLMGTAVDEFSRTGFIPEWHFDAKFSSTRGADSRIRLITS